MQKKVIAVVTGASSGLGKEFTKLMLQEQVNEVWAIARNKENLARLKHLLGKKIRCISLAHLIDLSVCCFKQLVSQ